MQVEPDEFVDWAAVLTCDAIGPINETPIRIATKPPINLLIILF